MIRFQTALSLVLLLIPGSALAQEIFPEKEGAELRRLLREDYSPNQLLSYKSARRMMFGIVDNNGGVVELAYLSATFQIDPFNPIPNHLIINTEHTWPQSKFGKDGGAGPKTDIHHLFPTGHRVNSDRGNKPFGEVIDSQARKFWKVITDPETSIPSIDFSAYSEVGNSVFEPEENHKGNVARAMVYFFTIYEEHPKIDLPFFLGQVETLKEWHVADKADDPEKERSNRIESIQGNINPFVMDSTLLARALSDVSPTGIGVIDAPGVGDGGTEVVGIGLSILALIPNPVGQDQGNESVTLMNPSADEIDLAGWSMTDAHARRFDLSGTVPPSSTRSIRLVNSAMILGNNGSLVTLFNADGLEIDQVSYSKEEAQSGAFIVFDD